jgi:hypothetical protein
VLFCQSNAIFYNKSNIGVLMIGRPQQNSSSGFSRPSGTLEVENLISIDPTAITHNFRIINEQLDLLTQLSASNILFD